MKSLKVDDFFERLQKNKLPTSVLIQGDDAYLLRELKLLLKATGVDIHETEFKKTGPESSQEDLSMGGSLFSSASLLWVSKTASLSGWKADSKKTWERIKSRADGEGFFIIVQVPLDRRMNWSVLDLQYEVKLQVDESSRLGWLKKMNQKRGQALSEDHLRFMLSAFDEPLLTYDNWIELWSLGGDAWAEVSLGWNARGGAAKNSPSPKLRLEPNENAAFSWVDCVLKTDRARGLALLDYLLEQGQEPLQLLALLGKSARILAAIESGERIAQQPEFLVNKLKQLSRNSRQPARGQSLLKKCADLDRRLKSSSTQPRALLATLLN